MGVLTNYITEKIADLRFVSVDDDGIPKKKLFLKPRDEDDYFEVDFTSALDVDAIKASLSGTLAETANNLSDLVDADEALTNIGAAGVAVVERLNVTKAAIGDVAGVVGQMATESRRRYRPSPTTLAPAIVDATFRNPNWLSDDGTTLFLTAGTELRVSTDQGATSTLLRTFAKNVYNVRQMGNGELVVGVYDGASPGELWTSTGYPASGAASTWVLRKVASANHVYYETSWGLSVQGGGDIIVACEYGTKMPTAPSAPRYAIVSEDHGLSWRTIFDLGNLADGHIHGCAYDRWWDRIWLTIGDDAAAKIVYSDDWREASPTWTTVFGTTGTYQSSWIEPMPGCVLFGTDGGPNGVRRIVRVNKLDVPVIEMAFTYTQPAIISWIGSQAYRNQFDPDAPLLIPHVVSGLLGPMPGTLLMTYDGFDFTEVWRDSESYIGAGSGLVTALGPTASGDIVGLINDDRNVSTSGSRLVADCPVRKDVSSSANGLTGLWLPGTVGDYISTPDSAPLSITGDLDLRILVEASAWDGTKGLISKWADINGERSYLMALIGGALYLLWSPDGTAQVQATFSMASVPLNTPVWLRATLDADGGATNHRVTLEWRYIDADASWTVLLEQTTAGVTSIFDSPKDVQVAAWGAGGNQPFAGTIYQAEIRPGRYAEPVGSVDNRNAWTTRYRDRQGNVWTLNGATWAWTTDRAAA